MLHDATPARPVSRRTFLGGALSLSAAALAGCAGGRSAQAPSYTGERVPAAPSPGGAASWADVRALFDLDPEVAHLSAFILAPHPRPVREAVDRHRRGLDRNPLGWYAANAGEEQRGADAAAEHLRTHPDRIALTDSTSMGLGLLIGGLRLRRGDEILCTAHDHYAARESARYAAERAEATVRTVELYPPQAPEQATSDGIVAALREGITAATRLVVVTWVHTASGIRLPLEDVAEVVADANRGRAEEERALLLVDGAHALGAGPIDVERTGCDAFVASGHKWLLGPRGTGLAWATEAAWRRMTPIIPSWAGGLFEPWMRDEVGNAPPGQAFTPGGYHSFEHRWAFAPAFELQRQIGPERIEARIGELAAALRDGLARIGGVVVHAPREARLRSGVVCFTVAGRDPHDVVDQLGDRRVSASVTPYAVSLARLGTCWLNTEDEVRAAVRGVRALA